MSFLNFDSLSVAKREAATSSSVLVMSDSEKRIVDNLRRKTEFRQARCTRLIADLKSSSVQMESLVKELFLLKRFWNIRYLRKEKVVPIKVSQ